MAVTSQATDHLQATLTIHIPVEEYQPMLNKELQNYKNKAQLKGFRKGKTPVDLIKKMYGNAILQEVVETTLQKQLQDHLKSNNLNLLGQPLPNAAQTEIYYNILLPEAYTFRFDVGYAPDFEIRGLDHVFDFYKVIPAEETIQRQFENLRSRLGELKSLDIPVSDQHLISVTAEELDGEQLKENGIVTEFSVWMTQVDGPAKQLLVGKNKGETLDLDLRTLHTDKEDEFIRKRYLTKLEEHAVIPALFRVTITEIKANEPAQVDQAFFDKAFGPNQVTDESQAKDKIKLELENQSLSQSEALLFRDIQDHLLKSNVQDMPDAFLKRWLKEQNPNLTDEAIEAEYEDFVQNLLWTIMRDKLIKQYDIQVKAEEIRQRFLRQILSYFGGMPMGDTSFLQPTIEKMMQNREQVEKQHDEILSDKVFESLRSNVPLAEKEIAEGEFEKLMEQARQDTAARKAKAQLRQGHTHTEGDHEHHDHDHHHHDHDHGEHGHRH